mmetsp:Transcript_5059/g.7746  ORF Transcript_5059/g.7746 Transcript_5059/m.7746 type:complete len:83 (+) Transcript_5059:103-351(+)
MRKSSFDKETVGSRRGRRPPPTNSTIRLHPHRHSTTAFALQTIVSFTSKATSAHRRCYLHPHHHHIGDHQYCKLSIFYTLRI